jgi:hypothetical protein
MRFPSSGGLLQSSDPARYAFPMPPRDTYKINVLIDFKADTPSHRGAQSLG